MRAKNFLKEFAPGNSNDGLPYAEYVVYQCNPDDQFEFIGGPLYQTDNLGMAHKYAYEHYLRYRPRAFVVYQPHAEASRGNYGVKGQSDNENTTESLDQPYKLKWEKSEHGDIDALARLSDGTNLSIMFNQEYSDYGEEITQVEFYRNNSREVTGEGDAQRIFATVLTAIQQYIKKRKPVRLTFSASKQLDPTIVYEPDEPQPNPESRAKLYDRIVQRYARAWGYRAFRADNGDLVIYELSRIKQGLPAAPLREFAPGGDFKPPAPPKKKDDGPWGNDDRSKIVQAVGQLLKAGNKVDWKVPGQMGHVVKVTDDGVIMKRWGKPRSKIHYFLPMSDDRDDRYQLLMVQPGYYKVVGSDTNWQLEEKYLAEIERISKSGFEGGKETLQDLSSSKTVKNLPGGSGLKYSTQREDGDLTIKIWDVKDKGEYQPISKPVQASWHSPAEHRRRLARWEERNIQLKREFEQAPGLLIAQLTLHAPYRFPLKNALQVGTITVDEDYRGVGLAKALYGIVLTILKRPLLAGSSQTPGGRRNWVSLSKVPGVEMKGYVSIDDFDLTTTSNLDAIDDKDDQRWARAQNKKTEQRIDIIMGKLGGQYIGSEGRRHYFAFDVTPSTTGKELEAYINSNLSKVYTGWNSDSMYVGLMATWAGK